MRRAPGSSAALRHRRGSPAQRGRLTFRAVWVAAVLLSSVLWLPVGPPVAASEQEPAVYLPADAPWSWPVDGARVVTSSFRAPAHQYGPGHRGMDVTALGADVRAPAGGTVAFVGVVVDRPVLTIDHGDGYVITVEPVSSALAPGDALEAGESIGTVAVGGHSAPGTIHIGVRLQGEYVNPRPLFGQAPRAILYPCCDG